MRVRKTVISFGICVFVLVSHLLSFAQVSSQTFTIVDRGGVSLTSSGTASNTQVGYSSIQPNTGSTTPSGLSIFGFRQNNVLVTEAGVPASTVVQSARIYAEVNGPVNTGLAIANPNSTAATLTFFFTNSTGNLGTGTYTIPANSQVAKFLNEAPFSSPSTFTGTFTFTSTVPVAVIALRGLTNERGEFLITTLPVVNLADSASTSAYAFPHFADGGGWTTQVILINPGDTVLNGTVQFIDPFGVATSVVVSGQSANTFNYTIPVRSSLKLATSGSSPNTVSGSVRVTPTGGTAAPPGLAIFSFRSGGITVSEAGVPAGEASTSFRLYAEAAGAVQTGLAIANTTSSVATITLELNKLDGTSSGLTGTLSIPGNGQKAIFLNEVPGLTSLANFQGVLRLSSAANIAVTGLRGRYNERGDFLITTTPPVKESSGTSTATAYFPHIVDSGGYTTQFIVFSGRAGQTSAGTLRFVAQSGAALSLTLAGSGSSGGGGTGGGGTGGGGTGGGGTGGGGTGGSGAAVDCLDRRLYTTDGTKVHLEYNVSGADNGTYTTDLTVKLNSTFEGQSASELQEVLTSAYTGQPTITTKVSAFGTLDGTDVVQYGITFEYSAAGFSGTGKGVFNPPSRDKRYSLAVGASSTNNYTNTQTLNLPPLPAQTTTTSVSETVTYRGRETVTVPAGTFDTCKFDYGTSISWEAVGKGVAVKSSSTSTTNGVTSTTVQQLKTATINGGPIN